MKDVERNDWNFENRDRTVMELKGFFLQNSVPLDSYFRHKFFLHFFFF